MLFESFGGNGTLCNPDALCQALAAAPDLRRAAFRVGAQRAPVGRARDATPGPATSGSRSCAGARRPTTAHWAARSYLINNATFPQAFAKRPGQAYLNTWHGTALKAMGYEMPGGAGESVNIVRNLLAADYLLAPNDRTAAMYLDAYRLRNVGRGRLLRVGTPRIDRQFADADETASAPGPGWPRSASPGPATAARTVLFAPTWRGSFAAPDDDMDRVCADAQDLAERARRRVTACWSRCTSASTGAPATSRGCGGCCCPTTCRPTTSWP